MLSLLHNKVSKGLMFSHDNRYVGLPHNMLIGKRSTPTVKIHKDEGDSLRRM
jgi:hypothetical protein